ncbi:oxaloacetate decarboxylase [Edaphobacter sp. 12200R-103]|jgi:2-methylisocitrate lyase-like PEP mutase family enzyme|uniref:isocitrate lyase/PEP mutase family protein n=1 Tax=Edaphobacter sp. 12200R-103 TaxID=2703788 RepID=UPI00138C9E4F|nr:isocitrate lyase/phosphoenolpyruvate mutase family protein [Edaphobacter sp. 12200R-103]QHS52811.1 isocitrate lyase/phosphoenolpyruvate mutase family protein [Edaphobacter sp. 12200R-103]
MQLSSATQERFASRRAAFRTLHQSGFFVIPNPWDVGTARYLRSLGFKALATTSSGFAFSHGLPDADWAVPRDSSLEHIRSIASAVDLPINADFESGYAHSPNEVAENVRLCVATGVAGLSIEDATGDTSRPLYELSLATERIRAARQAIGSSGVLLTARAEAFLTGHPEPLRESLRRLEAYAVAGADVLYAPGARTRQEIEAIVKTAGPLPVNVLVSSSTPLSLQQLEDLGVRRVSTGSALARAAWTGFIAAARGIARDHTMAGLDHITPYDEINNFFRKDRAEIAIAEADR